MRRIAVLAMCLASLIVVGSAQALKSAVVIPDLAFACAKALCRPRLTYDEKTGVTAVFKPNAR